MAFGQLGGRDSMALVTFPIARPAIRIRPS